MTENIEIKSRNNRNKDNIGWRYCLTMMVLCFVTGAMLYKGWVHYMDSRYTRVWEADKIRTLERCSRLNKLAIAVTSTGRPGSPALEEWFRAQTAENRVPHELLDDYQDWQVFSATHAAIAQLEYLELEDQLSETDPFREDFEAFGALIEELYAETGRPISTN